ncbi:MAG: phage tail protein [Emticicia sp.]
MPPSLPSGTVVAYAGNRIPSGWLLCDGSVKNQKDYPVLYNALETSWGKGDSSKGSFHLPDMRGMFLRGVDGNGKNDPDRDSRISSSNNGGNVGNNVGTLQLDELKNHTHSYSSPDKKGKSVFAANPSGGGSDSTGGTETQGKETRPKNVYVFYIIKE